MTHQVMKNRKLVASSPTLTGTTEVVRIGDISWTELVTVGLDYCPTIDVLCRMSLLLLLF